MPSAKRTFTEFIRSLTGITTPVFGVSWSAPPDEREAVYKLIQQLRDHRLITGVGHSGFAFVQVIASLTRARSEVTLGLSSLQSESKGRPCLENIRVALQIFQDLVEVDFPRNLDAERPVEYGDLMGKRNLRDLFVDACVRMQEKIGENVASLAQLYGIPLTDDTKREFCLFSSGERTEEACLSEPYSRQIISSGISKHTIKPHEQRALEAVGLYSVFCNSLDSIVVMRTWVGKVICQGLGFALSNDGNYLTLDFVLKNSTKVFVLPADGTIQEGVVTSVSKYHGLAVVLSESSRHCLPIATRIPKIGEYLLIIGTFLNFLGQPYIVQVTKVSEFDIEYIREKETVHGLAGSPILNSAGEVVGIHRTGRKDKERFGGVGRGCRADFVNSYIEAVLP